MIGLGVDFVMPLHDLKLNQEADDSPDIPSDENTDKPDSRSPEASTE